MYSRLVRCTCPYVLSCVSQERLLNLFLVFWGVLQDELTTCPVVLRLSKRLAAKLVSCRRVQSGHQLIQQSHWQSLVYCRAVRSCVIFLHFVNKSLNFRGGIRLGGLVSCSVDRLNLVDWWSESGGPFGGPNWRAKSAGLSSWVQAGDYPGGPFGGPNSIGALQAIPGGLTIGPILHGLASGHLQGILGGPFGGPNRYGEKTEGDPSDVDNSGA